MNIVSATITGSLVLNGVNISSITGSESSINALNSFTASAATTGSNQFNGNQTVTGSLNITGSLIVTGSIIGTVTTASYVLNAVSASYAANATSASYALASTSSSYAANSDLLDGRDSTTFANTGSNSFVGTQNINGAVAITGSLTTTGAITAQTLNVQQVTSSIVYSSGSNIFGNSVSNTQSMTGSVGITGSLSVNGNITGSIIKVNELINVSASTTNVTTFGSIGYNGTIGNFWRTKAGTFADFAFIRESGAYVLRNAVGTDNLYAAGDLNITGVLNGTSATFSNSITLNSASNPSPGFFLFNYTTANANSRSWKISNDQVDWGDFAIQQSTTQTGSTYATKLLINAAGAATFTSTINIKDASIANVQIAKASFFGYSSSYVTALIGGTGSQTLAFNVDVSANAGGSFTGNGNEYLWRNTGSFKTPNAANTEYNTLLSWNSSGQLTVTGAATFSSSIAATSATFSGNIALGTTPASAAAGAVIRLPFDNAIRWRNSTNTGDIGLYVGASNLFQFDSGINVAGAATFSSSVTIVNYTTGSSLFVGGAATNGVSNGIVLLQSGRVPQSGSDTTGTNGLLFQHTISSATTVNGGYIYNGRENVFGSTSDVNTFISFATTSANTNNERMRISSGGQINILDSYFIANSTNGYRFNNQANTFNNVIFSDNGNVTIRGALSKGSGSFRIEHPLPSLSKTHHLVHSFIEGPQADLIYRGKLTLINGKAQANIDEVSTMTEGTFEVLCREVQCFTTNESGWDLIKGKVIGNIIYIESQNENSTDEISWMVIGERKDKHMMDTEWTDENGKVIVEPLKPIQTEDLTDTQLENK
jgi:hypothetical protein